jgi:hypothetical protein
MIYLDSNVFIYPLIYNSNLEENAKKADYYLDLLVTRKIVGYTCTLTWDEVFYIVKRKIGTIEAGQACKTILAFPNLKFVNVDFEIISKAQRIALEFNIMPRDAIHAVCALKWCNGKIISNDLGLDCIKGLKREF